MEKNKLIGKVLFPTITFIIISIIGSEGFYQLCLPMNAHSPITPSCFLVMLTPVVGAVAAGALAGWNKYILPTYAIISIALGLLIGIAMDWLQYWHGTDMYYAAKQALLWCFLPGIVASLLSGATKHALTNSSNGRKKHAS